MKKYVAATGLLASGCLLAMEACGVQSGSAVEDAWIGGNLDAVYALNRQLSPFAIKTSVARGAVRLTGEVDSDINRALAGELAQGISGVVEVHNVLLLALPGHGAVIPATGTATSLAARIHDATTTASVKTKLSSDPSTDGLRIDVDTRGDVVTLTGEVGSAEESALAERLARASVDVKDVRNRLTVSAAH